MFPEYTKMFKPAASGVAEVALAELRTLARKFVEPHKLRWTLAVRALSQADLEISSSVEALSILAVNPVNGANKLKLRCLEMIGNHSGSRAENWKFLKLILDSDFHVRGDSQLADLSRQILEDISEKVEMPSNNLCVVFRRKL